MKADVRSVSHLSCDRGVRGRSLGPIRGLCCLPSFQAVWSAVLWCLALCAPSLALAQQASLSITSARMSDSHTLEVGVSAQFLPSQGPGIRDVGAIRISMVLNGKQLADPGTPGCLWNRPPNGPANANVLFHVDLAAAGVPRFTKNQFFQIKGVLIQVQGARPNARIAYIIATKPAAILLPVILIPGIDPGTASSAGGDGVWPALEALLKNGSDALLQANGTLGIGYRLFSDNSGYPTLSTVAYMRNSDSFAVAASKVQVLCTAFQQATYADAVNVIGHSKGGLVARQFVLSEGTNAAGTSVARVNQLIMCQAPHVGSVWATPLVDPFAGTFGYNYRNLYPLWNWYRAIPGTSYVIAFGFDNPELTALDLIPMPTATVNGPIAYTILYSTNWLTPWTFTAFGQIVGGVVTPSIGLTPGDFIVPAFSQLGRFADPNTNLLMGPRIPALAGLNIQEINIPGNHIGYMELPPVMNQLLTLLFQN